MTPQRCIAPAHEEGDCWRACIASILNLPASDVPNFAHLAADSWDRMYELTREWLAQRGVGIFHTYCSAGWELEKLLECFSANNAGVPMIISGQCRRVPADAHAIVAMDGKIIHDPSGSGVAGPWRCDCDPDCDHSWWWIDVLAFADFSRLPLQSTTLERIA